MLLAKNMPNKSQVPKMTVSKGHTCIVVWEGNVEFSVVLINESRILLVSVFCIYTKYKIFCIYSQYSVYELS